MSSHRSLRRSLAAGLGLALVAPLVVPDTASAAPPADPVVTKARTWLLTQQQADGGFEVAGFPGFETSDATLALAEGSQTELAWDPDGARAAIQALDNGSGKDPLDELDTMVETGDLTTQQSAVRSAKVVALVAGPLGIDPTDFDPSGDSESAVDLIAQIDQHVDGDRFDLGTFFNGVLYSVIGYSETGHALPADVADQIIEAQRPDGSWNFAGTLAEDTPGDVDTTSIALLALHALGFDLDDEVVTDAVSFLAGLQQANGAWQFFGTDDPNTTAVAAIALSDLHIDLTDPAWRTPFVDTPADRGSPYAWLRTQQNADGHINSGNDAFPPINTFATTQTMEALSRQWFLAAEHESFTEGLAAVLGADDLAAEVPQGGQLVSDGVGANVATRHGRLLGGINAVAAAFGRRAAVADLFRTVFDRKIDSSGLGYWSGKLQTLTRPQVLSRLTGSNEFSRAHASNSDFVDAVYEVTLGRAPDSGGKAFWVNRLANGESRVHVAQSLTKSSEFRRREVRSVYQDVVDRLPTADELQLGMAIVQGSRVEWLIAILAASPEAFEHLTTRE